MTDAGAEWADKDAFVMPLIPESPGIDPIVLSLLHLASFLELSGDNTVDPDWTVEAMESVGAYLQRLPRKQIAMLEDQINRVVAHARDNDWDDDAITFLTDFPRNFGIDQKPV